MRLVRGTIEAGGEVGVSVNGVPAAIQGTTFVARVPVTHDTATVTATATTATGATASSSVAITVSFTSGRVIEFVATPFSGVPPLTVSFSLGGGQAPGTIELDFDGDGRLDFTGVTLQGQSFAYTLPGLYFPRVTITDAGGTRITATTAVQCTRPRPNGRPAQEQMGLKAALMAGDINGALSFFLPLQQDRFRTLFAALGTQLAQIAKDMQDIQLIYVIENEAKYRLRRTQSSGGQVVTLTHYVYFIQDDTGLWRVAGF